MYCKDVSAWVFCARMLLYIGDPPADVTRSQCCHCFLLHAGHMRPISLLITSCLIIALPATCGGCAAAAAAAAAGARARAGRIEPWRLNLFLFFDRMPTKRRCHYVIRTRWRRDKTIL